MVFTQGDGGYIQMNQEGFIDLGEFDLSQFGPTAANPNVFTNPQLPGVGQVAPVDAQGNLGAAYGAVLGMQQAIPDPGVGYEQARAQRMQALMEDLGLLDQGVAAAQQQVAKQRERPLNFGNLPIGAEANALFGRAYDFAEGAIGQGRISAEAKLRAQANQALDQILSGNYQAGYQGQVQQALDIPNQALTAAGQFNSVGQSNQQASLQTLLEEAANRRAEMNAQQAQQLAQFGEQGTDARFRLGLTNSNNQLGITEAGQDKRNYYNAKYTDLLAQNKWFRELPFAEQQLALQVLQGNQQAAVTMRGQDVTAAGNTLSANTQLATNASSVASATQLENLRSQNDANLARLQAQLKAADPSDAAQLQYIQAQIANTTASTNRINAEIEAAKNGTGTMTAGQIAAMAKDSQLFQTAATAVDNWTPNSAAPTRDSLLTDYAYAYLNNSGGEGDIRRQLETTYAASTPKGLSSAEKVKWVKAQVDTDWAEIRARSGVGLSAEARTQLMSAYAARKAAYEAAMKKAVNFTVGAK